MNPRSAMNASFFVKTAWLRRMANWCKVLQSVQSILNYMVGSRKYYNSAALKW